MCSHLALKDRSRRCSGTIRASRCVGNSGVTEQFAQRLAGCLSYPGENKNGLAAPGTESQPARLCVTDARGVPTENHSALHEDFPSRYRAQPLSQLPSWPTDLSSCVVPCPWAGSLQNFWVLHHLLMIRQLSPFSLPFFPPQPKPCHRVVQPIKVALMPLGQKPVCLGGQGELPSEQCQGGIVFPFPTDASFLQGKMRALAKHIGPSYVILTSHGLHEHQLKSCL